MAVVTEWHDISSNPDEEIVIPNRELQRPHDENLTLSMQNLALTILIQNGSQVRVQPLKAPLDEVEKLTIECIKGYVASFKKTISFFKKPPLSVSKTRLLLNMSTDLFADRRDGEAIFINTYCLQK